MLELQMERWKKNEGRLKIKHRFHDKKKKKNTNLHYFGISVEAGGEENTKSNQNTMEENCWGRWGREAHSWVAMVAEL